MVFYKCIYCQKKFGHKAHYNKHINIKKKCSYKFEKQIEYYKNFNKDKLILELIMIFNKILLNQNILSKKLNDDKYTIKKIESIHNNLKNKENITYKNETKKKKLIPHTLRRWVWNYWIGEDIGSSKCLCCKITKISQMNFQCGHIISEYNGGELKISNLKPICQPCNLSMGTQNMDEFIKINNLWEFS